MIPTGAELVDAARTVAKALRGAGVPTTTPLDLRKLGKEIQRADRAGARVVVIIGPEESSAGQVTVRDLASGEQQSVPVDAVASVVAERLASRG